MVAEWLFLGAGRCWFRLRKVGSVVMALWLVLTFRLRIVRLVVLGSGAVRHDGSFSVVLVRGSHSARRGMGGSNSALPSAFS